MFFSFTTCEEETLVILDASCEKILPTLGHNLCPLRSTGFSSSAGLGDQIDNSVICMKLCF